jgi:hypothetical protein
MTTAGAHGTCGACACFEDAPGAIERAIPGIASLSSAHAAGLADDGLCTHHGRHLRATASCAAFRPRTATAASRPQPR